MWHDHADDVEVLTKLRGFKVSIEKRKERNGERERGRGKGRGGSNNCGS